MGLFDAVNPHDQRLEPGAYVHDGVRLLEVTRVDAERVTLLDCVKETKTSTTPWTLTRTFKLVRPAPPVPDAP